MSLIGKGCNGDELSTTWYNAHIKVFSVWFELHSTLSSADICTSAPNSTYRTRCTHAFLNTANTRCKPLEIMDFIVKWFRCRALSERATNLPVNLTLHFTHRSFTHSIRFFFFFKAEFLSQIKSVRSWTEGVGCCSDVFNLQVAMTLWMGRTWWPDGAAIILTSVGLFLFVLHKSKCKFQL